MSEYHAAVGLAELEGWSAKRAAFLWVANRYAQAASAHRLKGRLLVEREYASGYALYFAETTAEAGKARDRLNAAGIDHRLWYGRGLHRQPAYAQSPADALPITGHRRICTKSYAKDRP